MTKGAAGQPNPRRPSAPPSVPPALPPWLPGPQPTNQAGRRQPALRAPPAHCGPPHPASPAPPLPSPAMATAARERRCRPSCAAAPSVSASPVVFLRPRPAAAWQRQSVRCMARRPDSSYSPLRRYPLSLSDPCSLPRHLLRAAGRDPHARHPLLRRDAEARAAGGSSRRLHPRPFPSGFIGTSAQLLLPSLLLRRNPSCGSGTPQLLGPGGARRAGAQSQSRSRHLRQAAQAHQGAVPHPILR